MRKKDRQREREKEKEREGKRKNTGWMGGRKWHLGNVTWEMADGNGKWVVNKRRRAKESFKSHTQREREREREGEKNHGLNCSWEIANGKWERDLGNGK